MLPPPGAFRRLGKAPTLMTSGHELKSRLSSRWGIGRRVLAIEWAIYHFRVGASSIRCHLLEIAERPFLSWSQPGKEADTRTSASFRLGAATVNANTVTG